MSMEQYQIPNLSVLICTVELHGRYAPEDEVDE